MSMNDLLFLNASRDAVERGDTSEVGDILSDLGKTLPSYHRSVWIGIHGYEDDPREIYQIPEARTWWGLLDQRFPHLFYFLTPEMDMRVLYALSLLPYHSGAMQPEIDTDLLLEFVISRLGAVADFCWQRGEEPEKLAQDITQQFGMEIETAEFFAPLRAEFEAKRREQSVQVAGTKGIEPGSLLSGLGSKDTRLICAMALCVSGEERFIKPVAGIIDKITWDEVEDLSLALRNFGESVVPLLIPITKSSKKSSAACAMRALGWIGGEQAAEVLAERLVNLPSKAEPAEALVVMDTEALPFVLPLLRSNKADVRAMAAYVVGKIGDDSVLSQLEEIAKTDRSTKVQGVAYRAVTWLRGDEACDIDLRDSFGDVPL